MSAAVILPTTGQSALVFWSTLSWAAVWQFESVELLHWRCQHWGPCDLLSSSLPAQSSHAQILKLSRLSITQAPLLFSPVWSMEFSGEWKTTAHRSWNGQNFCPLCTCPGCVFVLFILRTLLPLIMRNLKGTFVNEVPPFGLLLLLALVLVQLDNGDGSLAVCLTVPAEQKEQRLSWPTGIRTLLIFLLFLQIVAPWGSMARNISPSTRNESGFSCAGS